MQKWPGVRPTHLPLSWAQRTQSRAPQRPQTPAPEADEKTAKGKCLGEQGALLRILRPSEVRGSPPGRLEPASGKPSVRRGIKERDWGRALPRTIAACHPCTCCWAAPRQGVPWMEKRRKDPRGRSGRSSLELQLSLARKLAACGPVPTRPLWSGCPRESPVSGEPGRRPGTGDDGGADLDQAGDSVGQLSAGGG